jgi:hypothetical protein
MNRKALTVLVTVVVLATAAIVGVAVATQGHSGVAACAKTGANHAVTISNGQAAPNHTRGKLCDTLTIKNNDTTDREIAFGPHEDHVPYDGVSERLLRHGQSLKITMDQSGTFRFHDHIHDDSIGEFTVTK